MEYRVKWDEACKYCDERKMDHQQVKTIKTKIPSRICRRGTHGKIFLFGFICSWGEKGPSIPGSLSLDVIFDYWIFIQKLFSFQTRLSVKQFRMLKYSCIIVEDEPLAAEILTDYIGQIPFLELKYTCLDAIYAMEILQENKIDLIFLDIHLPKLKGIDFLESLKSAPRVIITSAYPEYALQAFDVNVTDYLLKPIRFARFLKAVNKLNQQPPIGTPVTGKSVPERKFLYFNVAKKKVKIYLDEIFYIESLREYVRITAKGSTIMTKFALSEVEDLFAQNDFIRVHRSFIVSKERITAFSSTDIEINGIQIPIGRTYKDFVMSVLEGPAIH